MPQSQSSMNMYTEVCVCEADGICDRRVGKRVISVCVCVCVCCVCVCVCVCVCCVGVINEKEGKRGVERRESARVREAYVRITHVWLPRRPCKLGLALASVDPLLECVLCVCVFVCRHLHVHVRIMHAEHAHTCIYVRTYVYNVCDTCNILFAELLSVT